MTQQFNRWIMRTPREGCPYDLTEDFLSAMGADCDEIGTILAVIIPTDTIRFSVWQFHEPSLSSLQGPLPGISL